MGESDLRYPFCPNEFLAAKRSRARIPQTRIRLMTGMDSPMAYPKSLSAPSTDPPSEKRSDTYCPNPDCDSWLPRCMIAGTRAVSDPAVITRQAHDRMLALRSATFWTLKIIRDERPESGTGAVFFMMLLSGSIPSVYGRIQVSGAKNPLRQGGNFRSRFLGFGGLVCASS